MNRSDFYFGQPVTEGELDQAFQDVEDAFGAFLRAFSYEGIVRGADVTENAPQNFTVVISQGTIYDQTQQHIEWFTNQVIDCTLDELGAATTVTTPGEEKWLSIFAEYDEVLSDPRTDENNDTVYHRRTESFQINVVQSAQATTASKPPLRSDQILLADVNIVYGQTQILNADIDVTRAQYAFDLSGTPNVVRERNVAEALQAMLDVINTFGPTTLSITTIAGSPKSLSADTFQNTFAQIVTYLNDLSSADGIDVAQINGSAGSSVSAGPLNIDADDLQAALTQVLAHLNEWKTNEQQIVDRITRVRSEAAMAVRAVYTLPASTFNAMAIAHDSLKENIVVVGDTGALLTSEDGGKTFDGRTAASSYTGDFLDVTNRISTFCAVGEDGEVQHSTSGSFGTWTRVSTGFTGKHLKSVAAKVTPADVVAVGLQGLIRYASSIGGTWNTATSPFGSSDIHKVVLGSDGAGGEHFVLMTISGGIATSTDGSSWTSRVSEGSLATQVSLAYIEGLGYVKEYLNGLAQSDDGITWNSVSGASALGGNPGLVLLPGLICHVNGSLNRVQGIPWPNDNLDFSIPLPEASGLMKFVRLLGATTGTDNGEVYMIGGDTVYAGGVAGRYIDIDPTM